MDTLLRGVVLSYNRQEIVRPNLNDDPGAGGAGDRETQQNEAPAPEAHRTIAGGKRGEAERAHRMGREERNIRPGGAAEPTRDKILLRPCRGGSLLGGYPSPVGALGYASLPTGYCPLRLPAPGNLTIT